MMEETANVFQGSPQQDELWRREPDGPTGVVQAVARLEGPVDAAALTGALGYVMARHESLRTTFARRPGIQIPFQVVADELEPGWETIEQPAQDPDLYLARALAGERRRALDFERGPLLRGLLISFTGDRHALVLTASSLCADAASMPILVAELAQHYRGAAPTVEEPLQYPDFAAWQIELSDPDPDDDEARAARETWESLQDASAPEIPFTHHAPGRHAYEEVAVDLDESATPAVVHAAWHALLARLSGEQHVVVAFLSPERRHEDLEGAIGAFARPVPLSTQIDGAAPFAAVLEQIKAARASAPILQDYAPAQAAATLSVGFSDYEGYDSHAAGLSISLERIVSAGHDWRLWLSCARTGANRAAWIHYDPACHHRESAQLLARRLTRLIAHAGADQSTPVDALELLDQDEWDLVVARFNDTPNPPPREPVHELFAAHAASAPARPAVIDGHGAISYAELDTRANQLAHRLCAAGVGPDVAVGLCTDRSIDMVVGLLGILKAGGAYVPLNYEHPAARLAHQLTTADARVIVTQEARLPALPQSDVICLDRDAGALDGEPATTPEVSGDPGQLAYVIYTSGSTGTPKGVAVTHGNLANYAADLTRRLGADSEPQTFGLVTSISTDLGNTSVFGALASGGTLVLISPATSADAAAFARVLESTPVDVLKITPSHLRALLAGGDERVLPRQTLVLGGERATWDLIERIRALSSCAILNHYGPTETTIGCCTLRLTDGRGPYEPATVPIGRPISGTSCYVLDARGQPAPVGVPGVLFVGGAGVARGYVGEPDLTASLFKFDPFAGKPGARMYNTGDVVRWLPDGNLEFLGRADEQIKIRGYRVEPAEIEAALRSHPAVAEAAVLSTASASEERRLVAYCTAVAGAGEDELRRHLATLLPEFMLPTAIVTLEDMPHTPSGKIDRLALPDPQAVSSSGGGVAPRTPTEEAIAAIWCQTLGVEKIGVQDDFFELGGHSLLATQVVAQVRSELAVDLPLHSLFTCPTIELLAAEIVELMGSSDADETSELLAELEALSDEEARALLAGESARPDTAGR